MDKSQKSNEEPNSITISVSLPETDLNRVVVVDQIEQDSCLSPKEKLCVHQNNEECEQNTEFNDGSCEALQDDFQDADEQRNNSSVVSETDEVQLSFLLSTFNLKFKDSIHVHISQPCSSSCYYWNIQFSQVSSCMEFSCISFKNSFQMAFPLLLLVVF